jgi:hypothetical protein
MAKSGLFCCASEMQEQLEWTGVLYHWCPVVQFPTGFTESLADSTNVFVAYGINDVESRILVSRSEILLYVWFRTGRIDDI